MRVYYAKGKSLVIGVFLLLLSATAAFAQSATVALFDKKSNQLTVPLDVQSTEVQQLLEQAVTMALRQQEQYLVMTVKSSLAEYNQEIKKVREEKSTWIKACAVESAVIATGIGVACIILFNKKKE